MELSLEFGIIDTTDTRELDFLQVITNCMSLAHFVESLGYQRLWLMGLHTDTFNSELTAIHILARTKELKMVFGALSSAPKGSFKFKEVLALLGHVFPDRLEIAGIAADQAHSVLVLHVRRHLEHYEVRVSRCSNADVTNQIYVSSDLENLQTLLAEYFQGQTQGRVFFQVDEPHQESRWNVYRSISSALKKR